ncbi:MAG TPA: 1-deoxy-D-xylulose-5-phosphate reductoisomerase, partial [Rhodoferax sp.]
MNDVKNSLKQRVAILGSTGSIGVSTLDVIARHPDRFEVFALSASTQTQLMLQQCVQFKPVFAVMVSEPHGRALERQCRELHLTTRVLWGASALAM